LITDPPYGIGWKNEPHKKRACQFLGGKVIAWRDYGDFDWDKQPIQQDLIDRLIAQCKNAIIALPPSRCWLVWDKQNGTTNFADCELAWTNLKGSVRLKQHLWNGFLRKGNEARFHPTQKPLDVIAWALSKAPKAKTIFDPFMGSGTTGVAAVKAGKHFVGIERDQRYFDVAVQRIRDAIAEDEAETELLKAG